MTNTLFNVTIDNIKYISGKNINLELLLNNNDCKILFDMYINNLKNNYIKTLYNINPNEVTIEFLYYQIFEKYNKNIELKLDKKKFRKLNYLIKTKLNIIIGTIEILSTSIGVELGIFIDNNYSGKGYGSETIFTIINLIRSESNIKIIKFSCYEDNIGSIKIATNNNFEYSHKELSNANKYLNVYFLKL